MKVDGNDLGRARMGRTGTGVAAAAMAAWLLSIAPAASLAGDSPDCTSLYYGIGVPRDLSAAYVCFEREEPSENFPTNEFYLAHLAIMALNGEGTNGGPELALEVLGSRKSAAFDELRDIARFRLANADSVTVREKGWPRIDYCKEIASGTPLTRMCHDRDAAISEAEVARVVESVRSQLQPDVRAAFAGVTSALEVHADTESARIYDAVAPGTGAGSASIFREQRVREWFAETCEVVLVQGRLPEVTAEEVRLAEAEEEKVYRQSKEKYGDIHLLSEEELSKPEWAGDRMRWDGFKKATDESEVAWKQYRSAWLDLIRVLDGPRSRESAELGIRMLLMQQRLQDLKSQSSRRGESATWRRIDPSSGEEEP